MPVASAVDLTILGAGPAGLAAAYYAGHRGASVRVIDSLEQLGGQLTATYPEKTITDVAGIVSTTAADLASALVEQVLRFKPELRLGEEAVSMETLESGGEELIGIGTDTGGSYLGRALVIATGHGAFGPRKLPLEGADRWRGKGLHYVVTKKAELERRRCLVVGGGDSACDWAIELAELARPPLVLVHRRQVFRACESTVARLRELAEAGRIRIMTPYQLREIHGAERIEAVTVENTSNGEQERLPCEELIAMLGLSSHLGAIAGWGLEHTDRRRLRVDPATMRTSLPRVYAAGDVAGYEGKISLITIALAEGAIAANNAVAEIRHEKAQPSYSSE